VLDIIASHTFATPPIGRCVSAHAHFDSVVDTVEMGMAVVNKKQESKIENKK
jgi:hypothetical protein